MKPQVFLRVVPCPAESGVVGSADGGTFHRLLRVARSLQTCKLHHPRHLVPRKSITFTARRRGGHTSNFLRASSTSSESSFSSSTAFNFSLRYSSLLM